MKFREKKEGIKTFDLDRYLSLIKNNSEFKLFSSTLALIKELDLGISIQTIKEEDDQIILNDISGKGYRINELEIENYDYYLLCISSKYVYGIKEALYKVTLDNQHVKWSSSHYSLIYFWTMGLFFTRTRKRKSADKINCIDCNDGKCLWNFSLQNLGEVKDKPFQVKKFICVEINTLWVALNNHTVIALDIETGELKRQLSSISSFQCDWLPSAIPAPEAMQIHKDKGRLIGLMWEFYWEINPVTGEINFHDLTKYFKEQKIRNDKTEYVLGEKHIYFISRYESKLGSLNIETKKLDWVHTFEENEKGVVPEILKIKGHDSMLGALDRNNTLHIFERK